MHSTSKRPDRMIPVAALHVSEPLLAFVRDELAPGTSVHPEALWEGLSSMVRDLGPRNRELLGVRLSMQTTIDDWLRERRSRAPDPAAYRAFLEELGYLVAEGGDFTIDPGPVDPEISSIAGPQLVVPLDNARYALNAANARWGSLYDALYGTDVIPPEDGFRADGPYDERRAALVIEWVSSFLDRTVPLADGSHRDVVRLGLSPSDAAHGLRLHLADGRGVGLADPSGFVGFRGTPEAPTGVLLRHNDLHIELQIDPSHPVGRTHPVGVKDVLLESAVTTIQDCEDSVAAVDVEDKIGVYRNWLGLMKGDLETTFEKGGRSVTRRLAEDRSFLDVRGEPMTLPGRSLLLVRHVGLHMYTDAVTTAEGEPVPEGFLDAMLTACAALHDIGDGGGRGNSRAGCLYAVKPKLHGPDEVAATVELFARVEETLGMAPRTIKLGIMDEERRTSVNLRECIRAAKDRVIFINTGFLDRTGDEIHTHMEAGPVVPKDEIKDCPWMSAYEQRNVAIGIECGFPGRAQIGKGMWAMPDEMAAMVAAKGAHPRAGATTAWVPSPTAATLHALHYHETHVAAVQQALRARSLDGLDDLLTPPLLASRSLEPHEIQAEMDNNAQGILGYVARWVGQGVGCSKVPDVSDTDLMEDCATLRISSQHIANWLHHGVTSEDQVRATFARMAAVVDRQNAGDPGYTPMAPDPEASEELGAALALVLRGREEPNGYTESVLSSFRRDVKARRGG